MRFTHLPDEQLSAELVPGPDAPWEQVSAFGHRYHAYKVAGSLQRVADLTLEAHDAWADDGTLPGTLPRLRLALFHTVRAVGVGATPDPDTEAWARALLAGVHAHLADGEAG